MVLPLFTAQQIIEEEGGLTINEAVQHLPTSVTWLDVTGWSVWLYALASAIYMTGAFMCYFFEDGKCWAVELVAAIVFFMQGILDMVDFYRRRFYTELDLADEQESVNLYLERNKLMLPLSTNTPTYEGGTSSGLDLCSLSRSSEESANKSMT